VHVSTQVLEGAIRALDGLFAAHDPALLLGQTGQRHVWQDLTSHLQEASSKPFTYGTLWNQEALLASRDGYPPAVAVQRAAWHEQVDVGMPFESASPSVKHR
jgi:hypothetical protein